MASDLEITRDTIIADVLREHPECIAVFDRHGMSCLACMGASTDTIAEGALMHDVDADKIVMELNECCRSAGSGNSAA